MRSIAIASILVLSTGVAAPALGGRGPARAVVEDEPPTLRLDRRRREPDPLRVPPRPLPRPQHPLRVPPTVEIR